jgi:hypothetical protein
MMQNLYTPILTITKTTLNSVAVNSVVVAPVEIGEIQAVAIPEAADAAAVVAVIKITDTCLYK